MSLSQDDNGGGSASSKSSNVRSDHVMPNELSAEEKQELANFKEEKLSYLNQIFSIAETLYHDLCLRFFAFPIDCREDVTRGLTLVTVILGDDINPEPLLIGSLGQFREFRDQIEDLLRRRQLVKARNLYRTAAQTLSDIRKHVLQLRKDVAEAEYKYESTYEDADYPDVGLPVLSDDMTVAPGYEAKLADIRNWVSILPETVKGIKMEMKTVDDELRDKLKHAAQEDGPAEIEKLESFVVPDTGDESDEASIDNPAEVEGEVGGAVGVEADDEEEEEEEETEATEDEELQDP